MSIMKIFSIHHIIYDNVAKYIFGSCHLYDLDAIRYHFFLKASFFPIGTLIGTTKIPKKLCHYTYIFVKTINERI